MCGRVRVMLQIWQSVWSISSGTWWDHSSILSKSVDFTFISSIFAVNDRSRSGSQVVQRKSICQLYKLSLWNWTQQQQRVSKSRATVNLRFRFQTKSIKSIYVPWLYRSDIIIGAFIVSDSEMVSYKWFIVDWNKSIFIIW